jgi:hypothetical protein
MVTTTEYLQREAPDIEARRLGLMDTAKALADKPLTLPEQQVAGLTPEQLQAIQLGSQGIGSYEPFLASALQSQAAGLGTLGQAAQAYTDIGTAPTMEQLQPFMNPYQQAIQDEINRSYNIAQQGQAAQAIQAGVKCTTAIRSKTTDFGGRFRGTRSSVWFFWSTTSSTRCHRSTIRFTRY